MASTDVGCRRAYGGSGALTRLLEPTKLFCNELFGVEFHRITWATSSLRDLVQERDGGGIRGINLQPPPRPRPRDPAVPDTFATARTLSSQAHY